MNKSREVPNIKNGIVIDHIIPGRVSRVLEVLINYSLTKQFKGTISSHASSKTLGEKDFIKFKDFETDYENKVKSLVSIISPNSTYNIIDDWKIKGKYKLMVPEKVEDLVICSKFDCITNPKNTNGRYSTKLFRISKPEDKSLVLKCHYCGTEYSHSRDIPFKLKNEIKEILLIDEYDKHLNEINQIKSLGLYQE